MRSFHLNAWNNIRKNKWPTDCDMILTWQKISSIRVWIVLGNLWPFITLLWSLIPKKFYFVLDIMLLFLFLSMIKLDMHMSIEIDCEKVSLFLKYLWIFSWYSFIASHLCRCTAMPINIKAKTDVYHSKRLDKSFYLFHIIFDTL